jgi:hypothetical protein
MGHIYLKTGKTQVGFIGTIARYGRMQPCWKEEHWMPVSKSKEMLHALSAVLPRALPLGIARRLPSPELIKEWQKLAGDAVAQRARLVCLEPGDEDDGVLVVAVAGAVWRQEISMQAPRLAEALRRQGFSVASIKLVRALTPPPEAPKPKPRRLSAEEESAVEKQVEGVQDDQLKEALARTIKAQLRAELD